MPIKPKFKPPDETTVLASRSHEALAASLSKRFGDLANFHGKLKIWDQTHWAPLEQDDLYRAVAKYDGIEVETGGTLLVTHSLFDSVSKCLLLRSPKAGAPTPGINFFNGFLKFKRGALVLEPHDKTAWIEHVHETEYDGESRCPRWMTILHNVWSGCDDVEDRIQLLREYVGSCLFGLGATHCKALFLLGEGNNGKSTVLDLIGKLFPADAVCSVPPWKWKDKDIVAQLAGRQINLIGEIPATEFDSSVFKDVIDGGEITTHEKYKKAVTFRPFAGHIAAMNEAPSTHDQSKGYWRRVLPLDFPNDLSKIKTRPKFRSKAEALEWLEPEISAIRIWAIEGFAKMLEESRKIHEPKSAQVAKAEWQASSDQAALFVDACCTVTDRLLPHSVAEIYPAFVEWAHASGHKHPMTQHVFSRKLREMSFSRKSNGMKKIRFTIKPRATWDCRAPIESDERCAGVELGRWDRGFPVRTNKGETK